MKKKLQVFISSTYTDLVEERQAAVEAILAAGHIPAGMELFTAGNESQWEVIERWIDESDVFLLILGGRYGTIEPKSNKSYIELEYEYAVKSNKHFFAVIMTDKAIDEKVSIQGKDCLERQNYATYIKFKEIVKSKMCKFCDDSKDIRIAIFETLLDFQQRYKMTGWISGKDFYDSERYINEISRLLGENNKLKDKERVLLHKIEQIQKESNIKGINITYQGDLEERIQRITELTNAEKKDEIVWVEDNDEDNPTSEDEREISAKKPRGEFVPYFFFADNGENIDYTALMYVDEDSSFDLNSVLADIRMMLDDYKKYVSMKFRFILVSTAFNEDLKNKCFLFFEQALKKAQIENDQFNLEIWDNERLLEIEKDLGLVFNLADE